MQRLIFNRTFIFTDINLKLKQPLIKNLSINHHPYTTICSNEQVRVRFAPSPTGKLHIGGLRTAFYNYLFAKKYKGLFILRLEDTDQERLKKDSLENIIESLKWVGILPDYGPHVKQENDLVEGGPWKQSERLNLYNHYVQILLEKKIAYKCFCDETRLTLLRKNAEKNLEKIGYDGKCRHLSDETIQRYLNEGREYVVRFKLDDKDISYHDLTSGVHTSNPGKNEGDFIIIKSDKYPTYHFANVVDDHLMKITHVLRGQEWQLSTAKHISIHQAFGWQHPKFAHLPLIFNNDGSKISKRQNDIDVLSYRDNGYMPETLLCYLSSIGGGIRESIVEQLASFDNSEAVRQALIENFDETKLNTKPSKLNQELLDLVNRKFIQLKLRSSDKRDNQALLDDLKSLLLNSKYKSNLNESYLSGKYLQRVLTWSQDRVKKLNDLVNETTYSFLWSDMSNFSFKNDEEKSQLQQMLVELIDALLEFLNKPTTTASLFEDTSAIKNELSPIFNKLKTKNKNSKIKGMNYWNLTRLVLTGSKEGAPIGDIFNLLGKETLNYRLDVAKKIIISS